MAAIQAIGRSKKAFDLCFSWNFISDVRIIKINKAKVDPTTVLRTIRRLVWQTTDVNFKNNPETYRFHQFIIGFQGEGQNLYGARSLMNLWNKWEIDAILEACPLKQSQNAL